MKAGEQEGAVPYLLIDSEAVNCDAIRGLSCYPPLLLLETQGPTSNRGIPTGFPRATVATLVVQALKPVPVRTVG